MSPNWSWNLFFHLFHMPNESELLHMKTRLAALIKLAVAWMSCKCTTSLRPNTKKNAKTTQAKGRVYMTSDMSSHRYSQHAPLHKRKLRKESQLLLLEHHWALRTKTRQLIKMNAKKEGRRGEMWRMGKSSHWLVVPVWEKVALFGSFCVQQRG